MNAVVGTLSFDGIPFYDTLTVPPTNQIPNAGLSRTWRWSGDAVVLIHSHRDITPEDKFATAAAISPDGEWVVAGDLRLDARIELARSMDISDVVAASMSDEQLAARSLGRWSERAPEYLLGGFALLAWERCRRRLHLFVDSAGEKTLYFHRAPRRVAVANRASALLDIPDVPHVVDVPTLLRYFTDQRAPWQTTLAGIEAVPPGNHVIFDTKGQSERRKWWSPPHPHTWECRKDTIGAFNTVFERAVADRLHSLGPSGSQCSGGLDSTSVTAVAAQLLARQGRCHHSYTSVPHPDWCEPDRDSRWETDERPYVRALAKLHKNLDPTFIAVNGTIFLDCLPGLFASVAGPVRNTSNMPWLQAIHEVMQQDGVRLALTGAHGNSTISFDSEILPDLISSGRFDLVAREVWASPSAFARSLRRLVANHTPSEIKRLLGRKITATPKEDWLRRVALRPEAALRHGLRADDRHCYRALTSFAATREMFWRNWEGNWLNPLEAGMAHTDPTSDRRVVEFCWNLPPTEFRHGNERRRLIRRAMVGILPEEIRLRKTLGAQAPDAWMHLSRRLPDLRDAVEFIARDELCAELIDIPKLRRWLDEWPSRYDGSLYMKSIPYERAISMGLYLRWINEGLTELPGARPPAAPIIERG